MTLGGASTTTGSRRRSSSKWPRHRRDGPRRDGGPLRRRATADVTPLLVRKGRQRVPLRHQRHRRRALPPPAVEPARIITSPTSASRLRQFFAASRRLGVTPLEHVWFGLMRLPRDLLDARRQRHQAGGPCSTGRALRACFVARDCNEAPRRRPPRRRHRPRVARMVASARWYNDLSRDRTLNHLHLGQGARPRQQHRPGTSSGTPTRGPLDPPARPGARPQRPARWAPSSLRKARAGGEASSATTTWWRWRACSDRTCSAVPLRARDDVQHLLPTCPCSSPRGRPRLRLRRRSATRDPGGLARSSASGPRGRCDTSPLRARRHFPNPDEPRRPPTRARAPRVRPKPRPVDPRAPPPAARAQQRADHPAPLFQGQSVRHPAVR